MNKIIRILLLNLLSLWGPIAPHLKANSRCQLVERMMLDSQLASQGDFGICSSTCLINSAFILHQEVLQRPIEGRPEDVMWNFINDARKVGLHLGDGAYADVLHRFAYYVFESLKMNTKIRTVAADNASGIKKHKGLSFVEFVDASKHIAFDSKKNEIGIIGIDIIGIEYESSGHSLLVIEMSEPEVLTNRFDRSKRKKYKIKFIDPNVSNLLVDAEIHQDFSATGKPLTDPIFVLARTSELRNHVRYYEGTRFNIDVVTTVGVVSQ